MKRCNLNLDISDAVLEDVLGLEDRFVKFLAQSALVGLGFYAVLGSRTLHLQNFNFSTCFY